MGLGDQHIMLRKLLHFLDLGYLLLSNTHYSSVKDMQHNSVMEAIKALLISKEVAIIHNFRPKPPELIQGLQSSSKLFRFMKGLCEISKKLT